MKFLELDKSFSGRYNYSNWFIRNSDFELGAIPWSTFGFALFAAEHI
jgi:hypothetical protein